MDKSYVTLEQNQCSICLETFDTGSLLLDRRMRERFEMHTMTGHSPCPDCQSQLDDDFVALIEIDPAASIECRPGIIKPSEAHRTGRRCFLRRRVASDIFDGSLDGSSIAFIDSDVFAFLERIDGQSISSIDDD